MDQFYFEEGYTEARYFVYVADAQIGLAPYIEYGYLPPNFFEDRGSLAVLYCDAEIVVGMLIEAQSYQSSQFTLSAQVSKTVDAQAAFSSQFTQTAIGARGRDIDLFAFSDAAITAQVDRIRDTNITASSVFDVATDFVVSRSADSDVDAIFSAIVNGLRSRDANLNAQAAFSFAATIEVTKTVDINVNSQSTVTVTADKFRAFGADLSAVNQLFADAQRTRESAVSVVSEFTIQTQGRQIRDAHLTGTGIASLDCQAIKLAVGQSNIQSAFTQTFLGGKLKTSQSQMFAYASIFVSRKIADVRPRNLPITTNTFSYYDNSLAKFGTHSWHPQSSFSYYFDKKLGNAVTGSPDNIPINPGDSFVLEGYAYFNNINSNQLFVRVAGVHFELVRTNTVFQVGILQSDGNYGYLPSAINGQTFINNWAHILLVSDGTRFSAYLNNVRKFTTTTLPTNYWNGGVLIQSNGGGVWLDELSFWKGTTLGYNPSNSTITAPTSARTDSQYAQGIWHFDNNGFDDYQTFTQTFDVTANLQGQFTQAVSANYVIRPNIAISAQASVSAVIGKLEEINLIAFSNGALSADVNVQRSAASEISSTASITASQDRFRDNTSSLNSQVNVSVSVDRFRNAESNTSAISTVSASVNRTVSADSSITAISNISAVIGKLEEIVLTAFTNGSLTVDAVKTVDANSNLQTSTTITANAVKTVDSQSSVNSSFAISVDNYRIRFANSNQSSEFTANISAQSTIGIIAVISTAFVVNKTYFEYQGDYLEPGYFEQFEVIVQKTAQGIANLATQASLTANIGGSFFAQLVATSVASVSATVVKTASANISASDAFTQTTTAQKQTVSSASLNSNFALVCIGVTASEINMVAFANATLTATPTATKPFAASLASQATVVAETFDSLNANAQADIDAAFAQSTQAVKTVNAVIQTESIASSLTIAVKDVAADVVCESQFTTSIQAVKIVDIVSAVQSTAGLNAVINVSRSAASAIISTASISIEPTVVVDAVISTQAVATELVAVARVAAFFIDASVSSTLTAGVNAVKAASCAISAVSAVNATVNVVRSASSTQSAQATVIAIGANVKGFSAAFVSAMSFVVSIRDLRIDEIEYRIPGEGWEYTIGSETRIHVIQSETRLRDILTETALRTIGSETRIYNIE